MVPTLDVRVYASALYMLPERMRERIAREGVEARTATGHLRFAAEGAASSSALRARASRW